MSGLRASILLSIGVIVLLGLSPGAGPAAAAEAALRLLPLPLPLPVTLPVTLALPPPLPPVRVLTLLMGLHLIGLCLGLGGATMLDFWVLRWMRWGGLPPEIARLFLFASKVCTVGIGLLWLSGLGFLALYAVESPEKLSNPKLWAKVTVVVVVTLNGWLIHGAVLPGVLRDIGRPMLAGISGRRAGLFLVSGAISGVSWSTAFALGLIREMNGTIAYGVLIGLWLAGVATASLGACALGLRLRRDVVPASANPPFAVPPSTRGGRIPASQIVRVGPDATGQG